MSLLNLPNVLAFGSDWWLPPVYSKHGPAIDTLFTWIFWITMVTLVLVQATMVVFMIKYRYRADRKKAVFIHGNTRLEMAWTLAPAVILAALALVSKRVWDDYRYSPDADSPNLARFLVIGQQFKWNVVYPGPDGKLGRYMLFPKPTDVEWPDAKQHGGVKGPAYLPNEKAVAAINTYIDQENPLGKDMVDKDGLDDDWSKSPGRQIFVPIDRPLEIQLSSKDVIHDFFMPNFRIKLDAVPGMRGKINFTATKTSVEHVSIDDPRAVGKMLWLDPDTAGVVYDKRTNDYRLPDKAKKTTSVARNLATLNDATIARLKAAGVTEVATITPFEVACEELCGQGHSTMRGEVVVLEPKQFDYFVNKATPAAASAGAENSVAEATPASP